MADLYLHPDGDALLVTTAGELTADPNCCCGSEELEGFVAIAVCNANQRKDDNFAVRLNGTELGTVDNNQHACTGRIFATSDNITDFAGLPCHDAFEPTVLIQETDFLTGTNTLRLESIQNNGNNNLGVIMVVRVVWSGTQWEITKTYLNEDYFFGSGVGLGEDFEFNYP